MTKNSFITKSRADNMRNLSDDALKAIAERGKEPMAPRWQKEEADFASQILADRALSRAEHATLDLRKAPEGAKLPDPPIERTLTFNFTVQDWRVIVMALATAPLDDSLQSKVLGLIEDISTETGKFDENGRMKGPAYV
jgi:hypothetical protein